MERIDGITGMGNHHTLTKQRLQEIIEYAAATNPYADSPGIGTAMDELCFYRDALLGIIDDYIAVETKKAEEALNYFYTRGQATYKRLQARED